MTKENHYKIRARVENKNKGLIKKLRLDMMMYLETYQDYNLQISDGKRMYIIERTNGQYKTSELKFTKKGWMKKE